MDGSKEVVEGDKKARNYQNQSKARGGGGARGGGLCQGFLYYSSALKANGTNPRCIGIHRTIPQVHNDIIEEYTELSSRDPWILEEFYHACAGRSFYLSKEQSTDKQVTETQLPFCMGLEFIAFEKGAVLTDNRRVVAADNASAPAHVYGKEGGRELPQPQTRKPADSAAGDDFLRRYTRNASLVAAGVVRNIQKVGNRIKESTDDIMFPNRKRPK